MERELKVLIQHKSRCEFKEIMVTASNARLAMVKAERTIDPDWRPVGVVSVPSIYI